MTIIPGDPPPAVDTDDSRWLGYYDEIGTGRVGLRDEVVPGGGGAGVLSIVEGANITVDATDPQHPIVSASGGGGGGNPFPEIGTYQAVVDAWSAPGFVNPSGLDSSVGWISLNASGGDSGDIVVGSGNWSPDGVYSEIFATRNSGLGFWDSYHESFVSDGSSGLTHQADVTARSTIEGTAGHTVFGFGTGGLGAAAVSYFAATEQGSDSEAQSIALLIHSDVGAQARVRAVTGQDNATPLLDLRDEDGTSIFSVKQNENVRAAWIEVGYSANDGLPLPVEADLMLKASSRWQSEIDNYYDPDNDPGESYVEWTIRANNRPVLDLFATTDETYLMLRGVTGQPDPIFYVRNGIGTTVFSVAEDGTIFPASGGGNQYGWYSDASYDPDTDTVAVTFTTPFGIDASTGVPYFDPGAVTAGEEAVLIEDLSLVQPGR